MDPPESPPTLHTILFGDTCSIVISHIEDLADLAACWRSLLPRHHAPFLMAIEQRAAHIIEVSAPLCSAASSFAQDALWPPSVPANKWKPPPFFAALRAPPFCKVTGSGKCSHGLCQKQETAKAGVFELLERLAVRDDAPRGEPSGLPTSVLALECVARLHAALGRNEIALKAWERAAAAGSARAMLDLGIRRYGCDEQDARAAAAMLRTAADSPSLPALGLEGCVVRARALMLLGTMALDGDGCEADDLVAHAFFEGVSAAAAEGTKLMASLDADADARDDDAGVQGAQSAAFWTPGWRERARSAHLLGQALKQAGEDAHEVLQSMSRFKYFANGRP